MKEIIYENIKFHITKYEGYYVSMCGKILSVRSKNQKTENAPSLDFSKPRLLKYKLDRYGYWCVCFSINKVRTNITVHKVVAETFIGEPPYGFVVDHIDCNRVNNEVSNLRYLSAEDNVRRGRTGKRPASARFVVVKDIRTDTTYNFDTLNAANKQFSRLINRLVGFRKTKTDKFNKYKILSFHKGQETIEIEINSQRVE